MTTKRQFLDPIGAGCRFVLLKSYEPKAKLRITDHTVQVVPDSILEKLIYRPWIYGDSREDISALYPVIVRFIELYFNIKKTNKQESSTKQKKKQYNDYDMDFYNNIIDIESNIYDNYTNTDIDTDIESDLNNINNEHNINESNNNCNDVYDALKTIALYMIEGMEELEKTYEFGNAVFSLQYYINLLKSAINETYTQDMLPIHLKDFTSQNFLDNDKIKSLWKDNDIIQLARLISLCFSKDNKTATCEKVYRAAIITMLDERDNIFKQMISSTNNS
jgi:hypothetical protein